MKKFFTILFLMLIFPVSVFAHENVSPTSQKITLDGKEVKIQGYNIEGNNFFKLRDVAALLKDSKAEFNVSYDNDTNSVKIETDKNYTLLDSDLKIEYKEAIDIRKSNSKVYIDKDLVLYNGYLINSNNYFKLRDLGKTIGFYVSFDEANNTVIIKSEKVEKKDLIERTEVKFKSIASDTLTNLKQFKVSELKDLKVQDFTSIIKSAVMLSTDGKQYSVKANYNKELNLITLEPTLFKIKGSMSFSPVLKAEQDDKIEIVNIKGEDIKINSLDSLVDTSKPFKLYLGYYEGKEDKSNFRALSIIEYVK